jgi:hypothetical protein
LVGWLVGVLVGWLVGWFGVCWRTGCLVYTTIQAAKQTVMTPTRTSKTMIILLRSQAQQQQLHVINSQYPPMEQSLSLMQW